MSLSKNLGSQNTSVIDRIKRAGARIAYKTSSDYRQFYLPSDIPTVRIVIILIAVAIAAFAISDYTFFGFTSIFYGLVALRIGLVAYSLWLFRRIKHVKSYESYDNAVLTFSLIAVLGILLVNFTRPENFIPHIIVIDMAILIFYLVLPTSFIYQAVPSLVFSFGEISIVMIAFPMFMEPGLATALISLAFANIVGALISLQIHSYRWRIYRTIVERKQTDRLAAIGQTAGMIGHDIRNPLQAIVSELYLAKQAIAESRMPQDAKTSVEESIALIEDQTDYISKIVSDLQDYARPLNPEIREVDLAKLVTSVFQTVSIPDKITLKVDVQGFPKIQTDPTLIRRAITNLVNNALQAMPDGGILTLNARKTASDVLILVGDTGKGIPEEIRPHLFTPLFTTKAKGQGLGLAVVKRLVEVLGGTVTFESKMGEGTEFTVDLPLKKQV